MCDIKTGAYLLAWRYIGGDKGWQASRGLVKKHGLVDENAWFCTASLQCIAAKRVPCVMACKPLRAHKLAYSARTALPTSGMDVKSL